MKITVFTPTYNRGYILENLYYSLQRQSNYNFEWLIIDDGSCDNTEFLVREWMRKEKLFSVRYYKTENGGKHRAINKGTELARGELFFIVDSDDCLSDDAIETIICWENKIKDKNMFCGLSGNRGKDINHIWGTTFKGSYIDATNLERKQYNIIGDKAEIYYTNVIKIFKFPEFEGEKFITESSVWDEMASSGYKIRWHNKTIYISDYLEDGLTYSGDKIFRENPKGTAYVIKQQIKYYNKTIIEKFSQYNAYYRLVKKNLSFKDIANNLEISLWTLCLSILSVRLKDFVLGRNNKYLED